MVERADTDIQEQSRDMQPGEPAPDVPEQSPSDDDSKTSSLDLWIPVGIMFGCAVGAAFGGMGLATGIALGLIAGVIVGVSVDKRRHEQET